MYWVRLCLNSENRGRAVSPHAVGAVLPKARSWRRVAWSAVDVASRTTFWPIGAWMHEWCINGAYLDIMWIRHAVHNCQWYINEYITFDFFLIELWWYYVVFCISLETLPLFFADLSWSFSVFHAHSEASPTSHDVASAASSFQQLKQSTSAVGCPQRKNHQKFEHFSPRTSVWLFQESSPAQIPNRSKPQSHSWNFGNAAFVVQLWTVEFNVQCFIEFEVLKCLEMSWTLT